MLLRILLLAGGVCLRAQIPPADVRNGPLPTARTHFVFPGYTSLEQWQARASHLRRQILASAGLWPLPQRTPLDAQVFGRIVRDGYSVEKVLLETLPGLYLGGNLYRPRGRTGRFPGIASPHGHTDYGRLENTTVFSIPARCINLARQGYVVFSYDMLGYDDTVQLPHEWGGLHGLGGLREELWSFNTMGLQLWDSMRAIDFLQSLPEVDGERIGVTGASGGGTQTFLVAAVDSRVKAAVPVNMISAILQGGTCQSAPGLRLGTFNVEIGALMAPRPMLMISATGDWTKNTPAEEFPATQSIYRLYRKPELVETVQIDAPHNYNLQSREAMYRFFGRHLLHEADLSELVERPFRVEKVADLLALHNRKLPADALNAAGLLEQWTRAADRQTAALSLQELRLRLKYVLAADWPERVLSETDGERIVLGRPGVGDRVFGLWIGGRGEPALIVDSAGSQAARASAAAQALLRGGRPVLIIDAYQVGAAAAPRQQVDPTTPEQQRRGGEPQPQYMVFSKSDSAHRVQDILTALAFLKQNGASAVTLIGLEDGAIWSLFAAAVAGMRINLMADLSNFHGKDQEFIERFFVPGIQRAGGLRAAQRLVAADGKRGDAQ